MSGGGGLGRGHCHCILIVDDRVAMREMLQAALTAFGYDAREASDGRQALDDVLGRPPCAVLIEMRLPVMDGATFLRALVACDLRPRPAAIAMSGDDELLGLATVLGAEAVLAKPFSLVMLRAVVEYVTAHELVVPTSASPSADRIEPRVGVLPSPQPGVSAAHGGRRVMPGR